jgi:hypothetical protein
MHSLIAFSLGPIGRYVVLAGLLTAIVGGVYIKVTNDAADAERARIERANSASRDAADKAQLDVMACPAGKWNRERSRCEP